MNWKKTAKKTARVAVIAVVLAVIASVVEEPYVKQAIGPVGIAFLVFAMDWLKHRKD